MLFVTRGIHQFGMRHFSLQFSCVDQKLAYFVIVFWMRHLGCLASSVTVITSLLVCGMLLCREGLWRQGCSAAERKKEGPGSWAHSNFLANSTFFSKFQTVALIHYRGTSSKDASTEATASTQSLGPLTRLLYPALQTPTKCSYLNLLVFYYFFILVRGRGKSKNLESGITGGRPNSMNCKLQSISATCREHKFCR